MTRREQAIYEAKVLLFDVTPRRSMLERVAMLPRTAIRYYCPFDNDQDAYYVKTYRAITVLRYSPRRAMLVVIDDAAITRLLP